MISSHNQQTNVDYVWAFLNKTHSWALQTEPICHVEIQLVGNEKKTKLESAQTDFCEGRNPDTI